MKRTVCIILYSALLFCLSATDGLPEPEVINPTGLRYMVPLASGSAAQYQDFSWKEIRYAWKYEVTVQRKSKNDEWVAQETIVTKTNGAETHLFPGKYRFAVSAFNLLNRKVSTSDWVEFTVLPENEPYIFDKLFEFDDTLKTKVLRFDFEAPQHTLIVKGRNIFYTDTTFSFVPLVDSECDGVSFRRMTFDSAIVPCEVIERNPEENTVTLSFDHNKLFAGYYLLQAVNAGGETHSVELLALVKRSPSFSGIGFEFNSRYNVYSMEIKRPVQFSAGLPLPETADVSDSEVSADNPDSVLADSSADESATIPTEPTINTSSADVFAASNTMASDNAEMLENANALPVTQPADIRPIVISGTDLVPDMEFTLVPEDSVAYPFASTAERTVLTTERVEQNDADGTLLLYFDMAQIRTGFYRLTGTSEYSGTCSLPLLLTIATEATDTPSANVVKSLFNIETNTLDVELEGTNLNPDYAYSMVSFCMPDNRNIHLPMNVTKSDDGTQTLSLSVDASLIPAVGTYTIFVECGGASTNLFVALRSNLSMKLMELPPEEVERVFLEPVDMTVDTDGNKWIFDMPMDKDRWYGWFANKWYPSGSPEQIIENKKYFELDDTTEIEKACIRNKSLSWYEDEWGITGFGIDDSDGILKTGDTIIFKLEAPHRQLMWQVSLRQVKDGKTSYFVYPLKVPQGTSIVEIPYSDFTYSECRGGAGESLDLEFLAGLEFTRPVDRYFNNSGSITISEIKIYNSVKCTEFRRITETVPTALTVLTLQTSGSIGMWQSIADLFTGSLARLRIGAELRLAEFPWWSADAGLRYNFEKEIPSADITARFRYSGKFIAPYAGLGIGYLWDGDFSDMYVPLFAGVTVRDLVDFRYTYALANASQFFSGAENASFLHSFSAGLSLRIRPPYTKTTPLLSSGISGIEDITAPIIQPPLLSTLMIRYGGTVVDSNLFDTNSTDDIWSLGARVGDFRWAAFDATISLDKVSGSQSLDFDITGVLISPSDMISPYAGTGIGISVNTSNADDAGPYIPLFCGLTFLNYLDCRYTCQITDVFSTPKVRHLYSIGVAIKYRKPYRASTKKIEPFPDSVNASDISPELIEPDVVTADKDNRE